MIVAGDLEAFLPKVLGARFSEATLTELARLTNRQSAHALEGYELPSRILAAIDPGAMGTPAEYAITIDNVDVENLDNEETIVAEFADVINDFVPLAGITIFQDEYFAAARWTVAGGGERRSGPIAELRRALRKEVTTIPGSVRSLSLRYGVLVNASGPMAGHFRHGELRSREMIAGRDPITARVGCQVFDPPVLE